MPADRNVHYLDVCYSDPARRVCVGLQNRTKKYFLICQIKVYKGKGKTSKVNLLPFLWLRKNISTF